MQREGSVLFLSWLWLPPAAVPYPVSILSYHVIQWANFLLTWPSSNRQFINLSQVVTKFIMWLKMERIRRSDWRLEWERWVHFARSGFSALVRQEKFLFSSFFAIPYWPNLFGRGGLNLASFFFLPFFLNKLGQQSIYPNARDVSQLKCTFPSCMFQCQVHLI